jgi:16S rRNA (guanine527-N7)-methyltransferase
MSDPLLMSRLAAGVEHCGLRLEPVQIAQLGQYLTQLERWNRTINLTSLSLHDYPPLTLERLIFEPLRSVPVFKPGPLQWFDLGSGGGSPAIPLRIAVPAASLTMVESRSRKVAFLREVTRTLGLSGVDVRWKRVEEITASIPAASVDIVTVRALRVDAPVASTIEFMLRKTGRLLLFGPVDWRALSGAFVALDRSQAENLGDVTVLERTVVP